MTMPNEKLADSLAKLKVLQEGGRRSFIDCTSFIVMRELKINQALTTDHHFRQIGFPILPAWELDWRQMHTFPTGITGAED